MKILEDRGYIYKRHLSTGGEGEVHLIKSVDKEFIAKIFPHLSDNSVDILKTIQRLNIAGIPKIHDIFNYKDKTIIIRDYVKGTTLYSEIYKNEYLALKRAKTIILNICKTLKQLHNAKPNPIIYRDLKPENIIITPEGDIKLIDFGIARFYNMERTRDTVLAGTRGYTAPEVLAGMQSDQRSDIYSAGLLFYEMITGKNLLVPPFQIRPVKESNEFLPEWIDDVIKKSTDLSLTKRYKIIDDFINAIENPVIKNKSQYLKSKIIKGITIAIAVTIIVAGALIGFSKLNIFNKNKTVPSDNVVNTTTDDYTNYQSANSPEADENSVINNVLQDTVIMFEETKEQLIINSGANVGTTEDKRELSSQGVVFTSDANQTSFISFSKKLDSFGNGNQAIYIKFKPSSSSFAIELTEEYNCGISANEQGELMLIVGAYDYSELLTSNFTIEPDNWYHALLAMGTDGLVQGAIWEDGQSERAIYANLHIDRSFGGDNYSSRSWQANIGYNKEIIIEKYAYYTFSDFQAADRVIEVTQKNESYEVLLDLHFDDLNDFNWLYMIRDSEYHEPDEGSFSELTHNGIFDMQYEFGMDYRFDEGDIYHIRIKPGAADDDGTLLLLCFSPHIDNNWHDDSFELKFDNKQSFFGEIRTDYGYYNDNADGSPMLVLNRWYDVIVYLDDSQTFKYFVFEVDDSTKMAYGGAVGMNYWEGLEYEVFIDLYYHHWLGRNKEMPIGQVDFIRHSTGSINTYLEENIEAYQENKSIIEEFIDTKIEFVDEDKFTQHGY